MPSYRRKPKATLAQMRRRRFLIVFGVVVALVILLSPLLIAGVAAPVDNGPSFLIP